MDIRYQVFVSSTYADLKEERRRVIQTVMELDCIPAGMELFPAADEEQFEFIKRVVDDCDYYLLIIGGRYGTTTENGVSYTEQEYDYAVESGLRVIALVHEDPDSIPFGKSEQDPVLRERLRLFREKVAANRLVKFWRTADELPGLVSLSLSKTIKTYPAVGWARANKAANEDVLAEINELRKDNEQLRKALAEFKASSTPVLTDLAGLDDEVELHGRYFSPYANSFQQWKVSTTWRNIFGYISAYLVQPYNDAAIGLVLKDALFKLSGANGRSSSIDDQDFRTVSIQLKALGLVNLSYSRTVQGGMALFWTLTLKGEKLMFETRAIRKQSQNEN